MSDSSPSFSSGRRWNALLNVAFSVAVVLALVAMVNYLAIRHFKRFHLASDSQMKLAPRTLQVLGLVTNTIHVTVYYDSEDDLYGRVVGLLKEYQFACPKLEVERVDYLRDVAAARLVKAKYKLTQLSDKNLVIFDCEGRTRFVSAGDLSDYDLQGVIEQRTKEVRRTHFRGEMAFTSAIFSVARPRALKAYFLAGHGEHNPESTDQAIGYSKFAAILKDECNIPSEKLSLLNAADIPADCSLLIIAGPTDPYSKEDLAKIQRYLDQGGRLLALFNYYSVGKPTGLEKLLAQYDVAVGDNLVVDIENSPMRTGKGIVPSQLGGHPIVFRLQNSQVYLSLPRSIRQAKGASSRSGSTTVDELLLTGPNSMVVTDIRKGVPQPNPNLDARGSVPLMVAVERGAVPGVSAERGATRLVVVGDSFFLQNDGIESVANRDFGAHVANWLVDQSVLLSGVAPRPVKMYRITMTQAQLAATRWLLLVGMPGSVLFIGALVWWRRRT
jgi:ABC-2 type transport system permease protein